MAGHLTLHGQTVTLREFRSEDVDDVLALIGDERVTEWLSFDSRGGQQAVQMLADVEQRRRAEPRTEFYLAMTASGSDKIVGSSDSRSTE